MHWLLVIPYAIVAGVLVWLAYIVSFIAFFTILFTKNFPPGMFDFNVVALRWQNRSSVYSALDDREVPALGLGLAAAAGVTIARVKREDGLLGPESVAWRVIGHPVSLVGGLRSLIVQSLHPLAMAGVAQHSDYRRRPLDRLQRTSHYVAATTFGDRATAEAAAARVRRVHKRVRGIDPVTGKPYSADDPDTQLWVHCVEWHSFLAAYRAYATSRLSRDEEDRYIAEGAPIAALLGVPESSVPKSVDEMREYFAAVQAAAVRERLDAATRSASCSTRR